MRNLWLWVFSVWLMGCTTAPVVHTDLAFSHDPSKATGKLLLVIDDKGRLQQTANGESALEALSRHVKDGLRQTGYNVAAASDRGRTNAEITHLIEEKDTQDPILKDYSQVLAVKVHSAQKGKTPLGFSLTFGDSDPRAQGFQKTNLTPISCTLLDARDLREQASLTDYRPALNPQLDQGTIYAKDIQVVCHTLLAKLGVDRSMTEEDLPARSRLSKGSQEQEEGTGSNKYSTEETIARSRPSMESAKSEKTIERSSDSQGRKQIKILNQGNILILEFGHNRR
jgi:hypothetical protein